MSKAILVMEMPENCIDCPCSFFERSNPKLNLICGQTQEDVNGGGKPEWCPLHELPNKRRTIGKESENDQLCFNGGYNACIDEILGV